MAFPVLSAYDCKYLGSSEKLMNFCCLPAGRQEWAVYPLRRTKNVR